MRHGIRLVAVLCCTIVGVQIAPASAEKRVALAVGIDVYDNLPAHEQLKKAVNDARAMGAALRELGFGATVEENVSRLAFTRAWQKFLNQLEPGDTAALFFAGHGVEIGGLNYLLPRDVPKVELREDRVLAGASIRFNDLMDDLRERKVRVALFIVDACRDNPFRDGRGRAVGGTRGLARVEPAKGSFVMYSAGAGERALDRLSDADGDPNSLYTRTLLPILTLPGLSLPEIATRVRLQVVEVARAARHEQTPAYYDELLGDFVLKERPTSKLVVPPATLPQLSETERAWGVAKGTTSIPVLEAFIRRFGDTYYGDLAKMRLAELKQADATKQSAEAAKKADEDARAKVEAERQRLAMLQRQEEERKRVEAAAAKQAAETAKKKADEDDRLEAAAAAKKQAEAEARAKRAAEEAAERQRLAALKAAESAKKGAGESIAKKHEAEKTSEQAKVAALPKVEKTPTASSLDGNWTVTWTPRTTNCRVPAKSIPLVIANGALISKVGRRLGSVSASRAATLRFPSPFDGVPMQCTLAFRGRGGTGTCVDRGCIGTISAKRN